jgi:cobyrinic acid a,c-diamide synthase
VRLVFLAALKARFPRDPAFKVGPDFIDLDHYTTSAGHLSRNLDGWMLGDAVNRAIFEHAAADADIAIIEGMMGLFDGSSSVNETRSMAELATQLDMQVLLIIDGSAMARSAGMVSRYARFDPALRMAGVLFNRVSSGGAKEELYAEADLVTEMKHVKLPFRKGIKAQPGVDF